MALFTASSSAGPRRSGGGWRGWRDRLLADPRFQEAAARFPLTRGIARRRTRALFDLCAGFVYSQVLFACVRLRLFDVLGEGPLGVAEIAARLGLTADAAERLLLAARALDLVERRGEGFGLGSLGAALRGNPGVAAMIEHHALLYADLADPVALLRGTAPPTRLARFWPYAGEVGGAAVSDAAAAPYSALMAASQGFIAREVLAAYPLHRHRHLMDVGGGEGAFIDAAARKAPHLHLTLFDLPAVAARARSRLAAVGLAPRCTVVGGDFGADTLPEGADVVSLVRVIHDHDDTAALDLLRAVRRVLPPDGVLLLAEPMADMPGAEPAGDAYFGFYLMAMGQGRPRSRQGLTALLREAGFSKIQARATHTPLLTGLLVARS